MLKRKVVVWGTGPRTVRLLKEYTELIQNIDIIAFVSNYVSGEKIPGFLNIEIVTPDKINFLKWDIIIIISSKKAETLIRNQLCNIYNINENLIYTLSEYSRKCIKEYKENIFNSSFSNIELLDMISDNEQLKYYLLDARDYNYLSNNYSYIIKNDLINENYIKNNYKEETIKVWVCWLQGFDNAPPIVKCCLKSIYRYLGGGKEKLLK